MPELIMFTGLECPHCDAMRVLCARLHFEEGVMVTEFEVWHDKQNEKLLTEYRTPDCDGLPFFFNTKTGQSLCGEVSFKELKQWAKGNDSETMS